MTERDSNRPREYQGQSKTMSVMGRALSESFIGQFIGGAALGLGALFVTKKQPDMKMISKMVSYGVTAGGAVGLVHGGIKGAKDSGAAKSQYESLSQELETTKAELAQQRSFVERLSEERARAATRDVTR